MSGKCICKPGIIGDKCDICPDGTPVTPKGCNGCKIESVFHVSHTPHWKDDLKKIIELNELMINSSK